MVNENHMLSSCSDSHIYYYTSSATNFTPKGMHHIPVTKMNFDLAPPYIHFQSNHIPSEIKLKEAVNKLNLSLPSQNWVHLQCSKHGVLGQKETNVEGVGWDRWYIQGFRIVPCA